MFHDWLVDAMAEKGLNQAALVQAMKIQGHTVTQQTVSKWRRGISRPGALAVAALARTLDKSTDEIFDQLEQDSRAGYRPPEPEQGISALQREVAEVAERVSRLESGGRRAPRKDGGVRG